MKTQNQKQFFPVILEEDETGGYVVINPAIEGCYSQGNTLEEALKNIEEATELCLEETNEAVKIKNISLHLINLKNRYT